MGNFRRDDRGGSGRDFGRRSFGNDRGGDRQMHKAICSNCGKECEVPFKPTGAKPVYCSECFRSMGGGSDSRQSNDRGSRRPNVGARDDRFSRGSVPNQNNVKLDEINAKLDKILRHLFPVSPVVTPEITPSVQITETPKLEEVITPAKKKARAKKLAPTEEAVLAPESGNSIEDTKSEETSLEE